MDRIGWHAAGLYRPHRRTGLDRRVLIALPPRNTNQACRCGGRISEDSRRTPEPVVCVECGFGGSADLVGAINVLREGLAHYACEVSDEVLSPAAGTGGNDSIRLDAGSRFISAAGCQID